MARTRKPYPPEFRQQMVELVRAGRTPERPEAVIHHSDRGCQTGLKWSSQHGLPSSSVALLQEPRLAYASRGSCAACY